MSIVIATKAEMIKTRRSASFWISLIGSAFIPLIFFLTYVIQPAKNAMRLTNAPWEMHYMQGYQAFSAFLLPMFVILICSLIPQLEYKNNAWKQVFTTPQSIGTIFFSKYLSIIMMIVFLFVMFNIFMVLAGVIPSLIHPDLPFLSKSFDWAGLLKLNIKSFISLLAMISIQYWLSLRFRNFIVPIAIGLCLLITSLILLQWEHVSKVPYAYPSLSFFQLSTGTMPKSDSFFMNHELNSIGYFVLFTVVAFLDMRFRKERG